ncbi:MAG: M48 family metallopeptidase [Geminocystis sp.]|nr:M48 family metallopeptidase [Geminocystis sp.]HIK38830.1 M48 family metallopeptidase [Geminocystis sp. M7585_C2015_104]MCS7147155.1 M48 family metallopeptidase [Geminocystis sp.]MCX8078620.1 M48 family metallopeptidase [Geminocystis sp.]MDW8116151.1 M48 family metallopeptidase [Geminocystis sp.]
MTVKLIGLKAEQFRHPLDLQATNRLKQIPGLDLLVRNLLGSVAGEFFYLDNIASSIRISEKQLPDLYQLLVSACETLDVEVPQLYVRQHPVPNAYTLAMRGKRPFIVLHTSLLELLEEEEIKAVIAHELGHLKCEHGVYLSLANILVLAAGLIPPWGTVLAQSLQLQLLHWVRCAEFSCDRAALLAVQKPEIVMSVLMKLTGASPSTAHKLSLSAFMEQVREYKSMSETELGRFLQEVQTSQLTHPLPIIRAKEIEKWAQSPQYYDLIQRGKMGYNSGEDNRGGWRNW